MANERNWRYEKIDEDGKLKHCPMNDYDGKVTGRIVFGVAFWFDENPDERIARGWVKHITHKIKDLNLDYDPVTQYLVQSVDIIDEYTVEDHYHVMDKSEEQMRLSELLNYRDFWDEYDDANVIVWP